MLVHVRGERERANCILTIPTRVLWSFETQKPEPSDFPITSFGVTICSGSSTVLTYSNVSLPTFVRKISTEESAPSFSADAGGNGGR
jgi:hypothetical protein